MPRSTRVEFTLRALQSEDAAAYDAFLRRGIQAHPSTLRIAEPDLDDSPIPTDRTDDSVTLAAIGRDGAWIGVASVERERGRLKRRHIAWIVRMFVAAEHSGAGVGRALLRAAIAEAARMPGVAKLNLTVAAHNDRAVALYSSEGFVEFSREADAFRDPTSGAAPTELTMTRPL